MLVLHGILESLVVVLREGIEVALVVGILVAYLRRTGRGVYSRQVFFGLGAALLASLIAALLVRRLAIAAGGPSSRAR